MPEVISTPEKLAVKVYVGDTLPLTTSHRFLFSLLYEDVDNFLSSLLALKGFVKNALRIIDEFAKAKVRAALRELSRRTSTVKALHKPLYIVPHSLHPDEATV